MAVENCVFVFGTPELWGSGAGIKQHSGSALRHGFMGWHHHVPTERPGPNARDPVSVAEPGRKQNPRARLRCRCPGLRLKPVKEGFPPNFWGQLAGFVQKKDIWKAMEPPGGQCSALNTYLGVGEWQWRLGGGPCIPREATYLV